MNIPHATKERKKRIEQLQQMLAQFEKSEPIIRQTAIEIFQQEIDTALPILRAAVIQSGAYKQTASLELVIDFDAKTPSVALAVRIQPPVYQSRVEHPAK